MVNTAGDWAKESPEVSLAKHKSGPVRGFVLFASGVNRTLLSLVPGEESKFAVLGSSVVLTSVVAMGSTTAAASMISGAEGWRWRFLVVGLVGGLFVFAIDRILVKLPLNPYRFPSDVMDALWNPAADSQWFKVISGKLQKQTLSDRIRQFLSTLSSVLVRFVIAFCFSFVVSELAVIWIFSSEVAERVTVLEGERSADRVREVQSAYDTAVASIDKQVAALEADADSPEIAAAIDLVGEAQARLEGIRSDRTTVEAAKNAERQGIAGTFTLTDGTILNTSGLAGPGPLTSQLAGVVAKLDGDQQNADSALKAANDDLTRLREAAKEKVGKNDPEVTQLRSDRQALTAALPGKLEAAKAPESSIRGLLLRREALERLAEDADPSTGKLDRSPGCRGGGMSRAFCDFRNRLYKSTPMGPWIAAFRYFFLAIDMLPIVVKVQLSLRRRRPYDALVAAMEERATAVAIDLTDDGLSHVGRDLEARAYWRKSQRTGTGMEYLLNVEGSRKERQRVRDIARALRRRKKSAQTVDDVVSPARAAARRPASPFSVDRGYWQGEVQRPAPRIPTPDPVLFDQDFPDGHLDDATDRSDSASSASGPHSAS